MKIKDFILSLKSDYDFKLKIVKKGIFRILIDSDAFFVSKMFNLKITILDKETIKVWFPDWSKNKWLSIFREKNISYIMYEKDEWFYKEVWKYLAKNYTDIFQFNLEDYDLTRARILGLNKIWIEYKNEKNFLLKDKAEDIYIIISSLLMKLPKKERYYFREKVEKIFMNLFEDIYKYMFNLWDRSILIENIFSASIILREYFRFLYKIWIIKNDNIFIDLWDRWVEILKICKWIKNKN